MLHTLSNDRPEALEDLKRFFNLAINRVPNRRYLEELSSFLPTDFFAANKTPEQRWVMIKVLCKHPAFKKVLYSDWRFSSIFIRHMANQALAAVDLLDISVYNKIRRNNEIRHLILPNATNNGVPFLLQQMIVTETLEQIYHSGYSEEILTVDLEVDAQDGLTHANILDFYRLHVGEIQSSANIKYKEILSIKQPAVNSIVNYYLKQGQPSNDKNRTRNDTPVAQTSLVQWKYVAPIVCALAATAMVTFYNYSRPT